MGVMQLIAVVGGTGMTGQCVVDHALAKGYAVRMLYRTAETLPDRFIESSKLELIQGNALSPEDCRRLIAGADAVVIVLGTRNKLTPTSELSSCTDNLINTMKRLNVRRFSIVMSSFLFRPVSGVPPMFHALNEEHQRMLDITKASGLDYIAVLPPHIADEPSDEFIFTYNDIAGRMISKYDLAKFLVDSLDQPEHYGKVIGVAKKQID